MAMLDVSVHHILIHIHLFWFSEVRNAKEQL